MGRKILGTDIAGILARRLGPRLEALSLTKISNGDRDSTTRRRTKVRGATANGRGVVNTKAQVAAAGGALTRQVVTQVLILGDTVLPLRPEKDDEITVQGVAYRIAAITDIDPDEATYTCQVTRLDSV